MPSSISSSRSDVRAPRPSGAARATAQALGAAVSVAPAAEPRGRGVLGRGGSVVLLSPVAGSRPSARYCLSLRHSRRHRGRRVADILGLPPAGLRPLGPRAATAVAICALLGLAATQPVVQTTATERVRKSSQVLFVVDVSRSMLTSNEPPDPHDSSAPERRATSSPGRARRAGRRRRSHRPDPSLRPRDVDEATFEDVVGRSVLVEAPPPQRSHATRRASNRLPSIPSLSLLPALSTRNLRPRRRTRPRPARRRRGACARRPGRLLAPGHPGPGARRAVYGALGKPGAHTGPTTPHRHRYGASRRSTRGQSLDAGQTAPAAASLRRHAEVRVPPDGEAGARTPNAARPAPRGRRTGACGRARSGSPPAPFGARAAGVVRWCHDRGGPEPRDQAARPLAAAALLADDAAFLAGGAPGGSPRRTATGSRSAGRRRPSFAADQEITANVSRLDRAYFVDFPKLDPDVRRGQQSYPLAIGGTLLRDDERRQRLRARRRHRRRCIWQYKPPNSGALQELRDRRRTAASPTATARALHLHSST